VQSIILDRIDIKNACVCVCALIFFSFNNINNIINNNNNEKINFNRGSAPLRVTSFLIIFHIHFCKEKKTVSAGVTHSQNTPVKMSK
jgi:hypothetical protein